MSASIIEMRPWDEEPKLAALNTAANILYNAQLSGRARPSIHDAIAPYIDEGAEKILHANFLRGVEEGRRLAGRISHVHASGGLHTNIHGFLFSDSIHASGQSIPSNHMVEPTLSPVVVLSVAAPLRAPDVNVAEIIAACDSVFAGIMVHSQRTGERGFASSLECQADNAHASHLVLASRSLSVLNFDFDNVSASAELLSASSEMQSTHFNFDSEALKSLTASIRRSIMVLGEVRPRELLVCVPMGEPIDFPLNATASVKFEQFGTVNVSHTSAEFEEGFIPMTSVNDRPFCS